MEQGIFTAAQMRPIRDGLTVSRDTGLRGGAAAAWFSLGRGTSISRERYDCAALYLGEAGRAEFQVGEPPHAAALCAGELLFVPGKTLCGAESLQGAIYTEIILKKEPITMTELIQPGKPTALKELIAYEAGSIANLDIVKTPDMKFVLMAFDKGTGLQPHRAPGNAILTALEGSAVIGYEGADYPLKAGESFRFAKDGLHSVTAVEPFKMSLLLVLE